MISSVAFVSYHTSPLLTPGKGDAGGMNVVVDALAKALGRLGISVDVYTRRSRSDEPLIVEAENHYRVIHIDAGPAESRPMSELVDWIPDFTAGVLEFMAREDLHYDLLHAHYWLSGRVGLAVKAAIGLPLANSFHTLGRVKELNRRWDEAETPPERIAAEEAVINGSDCVIAATEFEAEELLEYYGADPARLCITPPGVDHGLFFPAESPRRDLGLRAGPLVLFVGRIQPLKALDVALEAVAISRRTMPDLQLLAIGGASGDAGDSELGQLKARSSAPDLAGAVSFLPAQPRSDLPDYYRTADLLIMPSRSESFGLVAVESQACGTPVVASNVGGLGVGVNHEKGGLLVDSWNPADYSKGILRVFQERGLSESLSHGAVHHAENFSWERTVYRLLELYAGIAKP